MVHSIFLHTSTFYSLGIYVPSASRHKFSATAAVSICLEDGCGRLSKYQKRGRHQNVLISKKMGSKKHQENSELPSHLVCVLCLRWGHSPSSAINRFCKASHISLPLYPSFAALLCLWMQGSGPVSPGSCMMPSCVDSLWRCARNEPKLSGVAASPCWQVCHCLTRNMAIHPYPDLILRHSNCKPSFYFKNILKIQSLVTLLDTISWLAYFSF